MTEIPPVPFFLPSIDQEEVDAVTDVLRSGWLTTGPRAVRFEEEFAAFLGAPAAVALSSCTAALQLGLLAAGVGPGDVVVTSALTFPSTVAVIEQIGAIPVLADVEPDTLNLDPGSLRAAIDRADRLGRVGAIVPVHLYGHPCEMDAIADIARESGAELVEDAAHAFPARYRGEWIGGGPSAAAGRLTCFSFYATKNLTTAEGGMLTGSPELVEEVALLAMHGIDRDAWKRYRGGSSWRYDVIRSGHKANLSDLQAAVGLVQLRKIEGLQRARERRAAAYSEAFTDVPSLELPVQRPHVDHAWHLYPIRLRPEMLDVTRDGFIEGLTARGIGSSVHFIPVHFHSHFARRYGWDRAEHPVATQGFERLITIPLFPAMTDAMQERVIEAVRELAGSRSR
jgi:dTDP-4-amino-4,6-dideoxygalactose transaminase